MSIYLKDTNGNAYGSNIAVNPDAIPDGVTFFAHDEHGIPVTCNWTLEPRGGKSAIGKGSTQIAGSGPSFYGTITGATNTGFMPSISLANAMSATYVPPPTNLVSATIDCVLTATSQDGTQARSVYINVQKKLPLY